MFCDIVCSDGKVVSEQKAVADSHTSHLLCPRTLSGHSEVPLSTVCDTWGREHATREKNRQAKEIKIIPTITLPRD